MTSLAGSRALAPEFAAQLTDPSLLSTSILVGSESLHASEASLSEPRQRRNAAPRPSLRRQQSQPGPPPPPPPSPTPQEGLSDLVVRSPGTGRLVATLPAVGADATRRAIDAASVAQPSWGTTRAADRADALDRWATLLRDNRDDLALLVHAEAGKPMAEARGEVASAIASAAFCAGAARRLDAETGGPSGRDVAADAADAGARRRRVVLRPVGITAAVCPWNFPLSMVTRKIGPALAAGCAAVLKASEETPLSAAAAVALARRAGVPAGVLSVVWGDREAVGATLTSDPRVRKLAFTGSTAVGTRLLAASAPSCKRSTLELGGNAPFIVFADADLDRAAEDLVGSALRHAGQTCICANRVLVERSALPTLRERVVARVNSLRLSAGGRGVGGGGIVGPLVRRAAVDRVEALVRDAVARGASILAGGERVDDAALAAGAVEGAGPGAHFFQPTVLDAVPDDARAMAEEQFGPIVSFGLPFDTEDEAVRRANATDAGLAAYLYAGPDRADRVVPLLHFGMVGVNDTTVVHPEAPFGGVKGSGMGREGGDWGVQAFLEPCLVVSRR